MRSQQHKLPEPSSSELGSIIMRLEKISAHMYLNIPKLKLESTPSGRNVSSLKRCNSSPASPSKLMLKKTTVMSQAARRLQEVKAKQVAAAVQREDPLMIGENQILIEDTISTGEDSQGNPENDVLMVRSWISRLFQPYLERG